MSTRGGSKKDLMKTIRNLQDMNQKLRESSIPSTALLAALKAVDDEPEFPGPMPDEMWKEIGKNKDVAEEAMRLTVRLTKEGIRKRIEAAANAPHQARAVASRPECGCSAVQSKGETV